MLKFSIILCMLFIITQLFLYGIENYMDFIKRSGPLIIVIAMVTWLLSLLDLVKLFSGITSTPGTFLYKALFQFRKFVGFLEVGLDFICVTLLVFIVINVVIILIEHRKN